MHRRVFLRNVRHRTLSAIPFWALPCTRPTELSGAFRLVYRSDCYSLSLASTSTCFSLWPTSLSLLSVVVTASRRFVIFDLTWFLLLFPHIKINDFRCIKINRIKKKKKKSLKLIGFILGACPLKLMTSNALKIMVSFWVGARGGWHNVSLVLIFE